MADSGIRHVVAAVPVTQSEYEGEAHHALIHGTSFPASPTERQLFYHDPLHMWYQYRNAAWRALASSGEITLGDISDVSVPSPTDGYVLYWDAATSLWKCKSLSPPPLHKTTHQDGGTDEISLAGLDGEPSTLTTHKGLTTGIHGVGSNYVCQAPASGHLVRTFTKGWTLNKFLQGAGVNADPTEVDAPAGDYYALQRHLLASRYHSGQPGSANITRTLVANRLYAVPFFTPIARTVTRIAIHVTTAVAGNARLGIYQDNGSIYPGSLVIDAGTVDTSTTGLKAITGLSVSFSANTLYWMVLVSDGTATLAATDSPSTWGLLGFNTAFNLSEPNCYYVSFTYDALPATYPAGATLAGITLLRICPYF